MKPIDLHVHSNKSDGSNTPSELVDLAIRKGLSALALTDHDTTDGIDEALHYAQKLSLTCSVPEIIPGIELSTEYQGKDVHLLGLYIDHHSDSFQNYLQDFVRSRTERNHKMCANLASAGIDISYEKLLERFPDCVLTRAHYAMYICEHGYTSSEREAFAQYVGDNTKYFVPREKITPHMAVELILQAGGIPILAHPILYGMSDARLETLIAQLTEVGLAGLEALYSTYTTADEHLMRKFARKYGLYISGGSDYHGVAKEGLELGTGYGKLFVPEDLLEQFKK